MNHASGRDGSSPRLWFVEVAPQDDDLPTRIFGATKVLPDGYRHRVPIVKFSGGVILHKWIHEQAENTDYCELCDEARWQEAGYLLGSDIIKEEM